MKKTIVMCFPSNFNVDYVINPWMIDNVQSVDKLKAIQQWNNLRNALMAANVDVIVMSDQPKSCPDAVFTANAGITFKNKFLLSIFKHEERRGEEDYFANWFDDHYFEIHIPKINMSSFEGAGDVLLSHDQKIAWMGFGFRTSLDMKSDIEAFFSEEITVRPLKLVDERFYHLDTCFCPLDTGELLWYPAAFDDHSQYIIETWYGDKAIAVSEDDAMGFACNAVSSGKNIIMPLVSNDLVNILTQKCYNITQVDMSEYLRSGGACKCLTLEIIE